MSRGVAILISVATACSSTPSSEPPIASAPPPQAAYVWQRHWTPSVRDAVASPPAGIDGLRVLIAEVSTTATANNATSMETVAVDAPSLTAARVPVTLVVRIEGARPIDRLSLAPIVVRADELRAAGVRVAGIEIDHDCATARLPEYARWLARERGAAFRAHDSVRASDRIPPAPYRFSITALPTWASSAALAEVASNVDEMVVQVHAVRAPMIFDANAAWRDLSRFVRALEVAQAATSDRTDVRVALPTYSAVVRDVVMSVDPDDVARFVRRLTNSMVDGIVWFRLPVDGDEQTWSRATFARLVRGTTRKEHASPPRGAAQLDGGRSARIELVARGGQRYDVFASNDADEHGELPVVHVAGEIVAADMVAGYRPAGPGRWEAPRRALARGERIAIGWIHGKDITLVE
ncbi:MAG: DUF3142 domain-containing protein [Kofleriaceae bacterium]